MALPQKYIDGSVEQSRHTEDEYFAFEQTAFGRWEYVGGETRAMSGGTDDHSAIFLNVGRLLGNAVVPKGSRVYVTDMKIHTGDGVNTFPDVAVICGPIQYYRGRTLASPGVCRTR